MEDLALYTDALHSPLFINGPIVIFIMENKDSWSIVEVSKNIKKMYGYTPFEYSDGEISHMDKIHPADRVRVLEKLSSAKSLNEESVEHKPYRYEDSTGVYHWVSDSTTLLRDKRGEITHFISYITDITEYVLSNEKLLETNSLYNKLFEISPVGLANNKMSDGSFVEINASLHNMCGYTKEEFKKLSYWDITPITYKAQEEKQLKLLQKNGKYSLYKKEYIHKDGHKVSVLLNGIKHTDSNGEEYILSVIQDISELQEAFNDVKSNELKFASIFENVNEGISILKNGIFTKVNSKLTEMFVCDNGYFIGQSLLDISPEFQADGESSQEKSSKLIEKVLSGEPQVFDWQHITPQGKILDFEISFGFIPNGENSFIICLWRDISDRINMLKKLQEAKEKADNANMLKSRFLANMSHEIRTPMNGILGFVDILAKGETDRRRQELYGHIKNSGKTLLAIINDILDISKIESGKLEIEQIEFSADELFDNVAKLYRNLCLDKDVTFIYTRELDFPKKLLGDDVRIKQVLINFLSNALKFTQKGGEIYYDVKYNESYLTCSIQDNGTGIQKENLEKIFNDFEQEDISTTRKYGGTGLGLSISSKLVSLMNGKIDVLSEFGEGSTFSFTIPLEYIAYSSQEEDFLEENDDNCFDGHVLIVEDNKTNQLLLSILLEDFGVTFEIANDGLESLESVKKSKYNIIFMDENMPNMNGAEATKEIRKGQTNNKDIPIIALTANALTGDRQKFLDAGMSEYISKPYDDEDIRRVLQKYLPTHVC